jgi:hypothetical protein
MLQVICLTNEAKETLDAPVLKIATLYTHTHTHTQSIHETKKKQINMPAFTGNL